MSSSSTFSSCSHDTSTLFSCAVFSLPPTTSSRCSSLFELSDRRVQRKQEKRTENSCRQCHRHRSRSLTSTSAESTCRLIIEFQVRKCENNIYHLFLIHNTLLKAPNCITIEGALCQQSQHFASSFITFRMEKHRSEPENLRENSMFFLDLFMLCKNQYFDENQDFSMIQLTFTLFIDDIAYAALPNTQC